MSETPTAKPGYTVTYSDVVSSNVSHQPPTMWWSDVDVPVTHHVYRAVLPDGSIVDHMCDGTACRLPEEMIEATCRMRMQARD